MGIFDKFKIGFRKSASAFTSGLKEIIVKKEINDENLNKTNNDCSDIDISFIDLSFSEIYQVESYINCTLGNNSEDISAILFDDISNSTIKYCFDIGNYVIMNVPQSNPIDADAIRQ